MTRPEAPAPPRPRSGVRIPRTSRLQVPGSHVEVYSVQDDVRNLLQRPLPVRYPLILTDLAYDSVDRQRQDTKSARLVEWFDTHDPAWQLETLGLLLEQALDPGGFVCALVNWETMIELAIADGLDFRSLRAGQAPRGQTSGLRWREPWPWIKTNRDGKSVNRGMGYYGRKSHEYVLVLQGPKGPHEWTKKALRKAADTLVDEDIEGFWLWASASRGIYATGRNKGWPTQKPPALALALMTVFAVPGRPVLDPFAGSGDWIYRAAKASTDIPELHFIDIHPNAPCHALRTQEGSPWL